MADIPNVGDAKKGRRFPQLDQSLADAVAGMPNVSKAMREALGTTRLSSAMGERSTLDTAMKEALAGSLGEYHKSREHMRDVFGAGSVADEAAKWINGQSATSEIDRYMAELQRPSDGFRVHDLPPLPPMPPNPIHETNEHLADLGDKIDALVDLQARGADVIDKLLQAQIANEAAQERSDRRAYRLSVVNTVLATLLGLVAIIVTVAVAS